MRWALVLTFAFASFVSAADISGKWKGTAETQFGTFERSFDFKVDGNKLTGETSSDRFGKSTIEDGKIDGDNISFTISINFDGNEGKVAYKGKVTGDVIKFKVEVPGVDDAIEYTAKRVS